MSFFNELKRRNVFKVGIAYIVLAWLVMQVADVILNNIVAPGWVFHVLLLFILIGFPFAIFFAWAFELTPDGIKRESEVEAEHSIKHQTGRKLNRLITIVLLLAIAGLVTERLMLVQTPSDSTASQPSVPSTEQTESALDTRKSIAVLPFSNLSTDEENAFFAAGVHEDILTNLTRVSGLRVNSRTSVMQYADSQQNMKEVAKALGVSFILEGSVRRSGNRVRVTAQLIDAQNDVHLWAENFDRELTDIFAIQTAVASEIAKALEAELSPAEEKLIAAQPSASIEAYDYFLRARAVMQDSDYASGFNDKAVKLLETAVQIDPTYARAWALLAINHGDYYWFRVDPSPQRLVSMKMALDKAFELQPDLPEARLALATYYYRGFYDYPRALEQLKLVRTVLPNDTAVHFNLGLTYRRLGQYERSIESFLHATSLDPYREDAWAEALQTANNANLSAHSKAIAEEVRERFPGKARMVAELAIRELTVVGDTARAQQILDSIPELDHYYLWGARDMTALWSRDYLKAANYAVEDNYVNNGLPGWGQMLAGMYFTFGGYTEKAAVMLEQASQMLSVEVTKQYADNYAWPHMAYAQVLVLTGQPEAAMQSCQRTLEILPPEKDKVHGTYFAGVCAWVAGMAGHTERALDEVEIALEYGYSMNYLFLANSPEWDFLRDNERFKQILARAKLDFEASR